MFLKWFILSVDLMEILKAERLIYLQAKIIHLAKKNDFLVLLK